MPLLKTFHSEQDLSHAAVVAMYWYTKKQIWLAGEIWVWNTLEPEKLERTCFVSSDV
jgi:hypothetical protein